MARRRLIPRLPTPTQIRNAFRILERVYDDKLGALDDSVQAVDNNIHNLHQKDEDTHDLECESWKKQEKRDDLESAWETLYGALTVLRPRRAKNRGS